MSCKLCEQVKEKDFLYEDEHVAVFLPEKPASSGHVIVAPKQHIPILEAVPDFIIGKMSSIANKLSMALFEGLRASGTNIVIQNGVPAGQIIPHAHMHVIPRKEGDGLPLDWDPKQLPQEQIKELAEKIKGEASSVGGFQKKEKKPIELKEEVEKIEESEETNYMIKQLQRIP